MKSTLLALSILLGMCIGLAGPWRSAADPTVPRIGEGPRPGLLYLKTNVPPDSVHCIRVKGDREYIAAIARGFPKPVMAPSLRIVEAVTQPTDTLAVWWYTDSGTFFFGWVDPVDVGDKARYRYRFWIKGKAHDVEEVGK